MACDNKCDVAVAHLCPYAEEIHGDSETECNCCHDCTQECRDDI